MIFEYFWFVLLDWFEEEKEKGKHWALFEHQWQKWKPTDKAGDALAVRLIWCNLCNLIALSPHTVYRCPKLCVSRLFNAQNARSTQMSMVFWALNLDHSIWSYRKGSKIHQDCTKALIKLPGRLEAVSNLHGSTPNDFDEWFPHVATCVQQIQDYGVNLESFSQATKCRACSTESFKNRCPAINGMKKILRKKGLEGPLGISGSAQASPPQSPRAWPSQSAKPFLSPWDNTPVASKELRDPNWMNIEFPRIWILNHQCPLIIDLGGYVSRLNVHMWMMYLILSHAWSAHIRSEG